MKRRDFFRRLGVLTAGFSILPAATTYARSWKPRSRWTVVPKWKLGSPELRINPDWVDAPYEMAFYFDPSYERSVVPVVFKRGGKTELAGLEFKRTVEESGSEFYRLPGPGLRLVRSGSGIWPADPLLASEFPLLPE
jgi:hypothetical protein